jgi:hypothetical protein
VDAAGADPAALTAMITPAVLVTACGSLLLTTSQRLARSIERARSLGRRFEALARDPAAAPPDDERAFLAGQMGLATRRVRLLQRVMLYLYVALGVFVSASVAAGAMSAGGFDYAWAAASLGLLGVGLLFTASVYLIVESRIALVAVEAEMRFLTGLGRRLVPAEFEPRV